MSKSKKYIHRGIVFNGISIVFIRIDFVPEFIRGLCVALGLSFLFMGWYYQNHDTPRFIRYKRYLINKLLHPSK
jgi:hypothetical protein